MLNLNPSTIFEQRILRVGKAIKKGFIGQGFYWIKGLVQPLFFQIMCYYDKGKKTNIFLPLTKSVFY